MTCSCYLHGGPSDQNLTLKFTLYIKQIKPDDVVNKERLHFARAYPSCTLRGS